MQNNNGLKVFLSYSHKDNEPNSPHIDNFLNHIAPLKAEGLIDEWYDGNILSGEYQQQIDQKLENADIICLFVSANFLSSENCRIEKEKALELRCKRMVSVLPIILSPCGWLDNKGISDLLATPKDGKPVSDFSNSDQAWHEVYTRLKNIAMNELKIKHLALKDDFKNFLQDTEMLTKANSKKEKLFLDDIFVPVELEKYVDYKVDEKVSSDLLVDNLLECKRIIISGEAQSGKTTLCKKIYSDLRDLNLIPVYISDKRNRFVGKIENFISASLDEQYENFENIEIDKNRIIPIVDDFHYAKNKEKHIDNLLNYTHSILVVDDIFGLNIEDETLISSFANFRIKELKPSLRYGLVKKWVSLSDNDIVTDYQSIDKHTGLINSTLGKNIGKGIMPAYPFFILSTILAYETFSISLDQEITSQGYCYQAFIYFYLRRNGVKNDEIDIYINFLTELAYHIHEENKEELSPEDFAQFMVSYQETYNLPIKEEIVLSNLSEIVSIDSFRNYSFRYPYFYYYFVAKYLSDHIDDTKVIEEIKRILNNLHQNKNAYISIFLTHHSKNNRIFEEIEGVALSLFKKYRPATLTKKETKFFDAQAHNIVKAVLPPSNNNPEKERMELLTLQDELEQSNESVEQSDEFPENDNFAIELRRAVKTVEVMGCIIKNRAGSLKKAELEKLFEDGMDIHLRVLSAFFDLIKDETNQNEIVDFIAERMDHLEEIKDTHNKPNLEEKKEMANKLFWNINYFVVCGFIEKIIHSLGSDKLLEIVKKVCDEVDTPASFLVKHGILMEYNKNVRISEIAGKNNEDSFSAIAKKAIRLMVINYCTLNRITYADRQRLNSQLGISSKITIPEQTHEG